MRIQIVRSGIQIVDLQLNHVEAGDQISIDLQETGAGELLVDTGAEGDCASPERRDGKDTDVDLQRPMVPLPAERAAEAGRGQPKQLLRSGTLAAKCPQHLGEEALGGGEDREEPTAGRRGGGANPKTIEEEAEHTTEGTEAEAGGAGVGARDVPHPAATALVAPTGLAQHSEADSPQKREHSEHDKFEHNIVIDDQLLANIPGKTGLGEDRVWPSVGAAQAGSGDPGGGGQIAQQRPEIPDFPCQFKHHRLDTFDAEGFEADPTQWHEMVEQEREGEQDSSDDEEHDEEHEGLSGNDCEEQDDEEREGHDVLHDEEHEGQEQEGSEQEEQPDKSDEGQQLAIFDKFEEILKIQGADLTAEAQDMLRKRMADMMRENSPKAKSTLSQDCMASESKTRNVKAKGFAHKPKQQLQV